MRVPPAEDQVGRVGTAAGRRACVQLSDRRAEAERRRAGSLRAVALNQRMATVVERRWSLPVSLQLLLFVALLGVAFGDESCDASIDHCSQRGAALLKGISLLMATRRREDRQAVGRRMARTLGAEAARTDEENPTAVGPQEAARQAALGHQVETRCLARTRPDFVRSPRWHTDWCGQGMGN